MEGTSDLTASNRRRRTALVRRRVALAVVFLASGIAAIAGSFLVAGESPAFLVVAVAATLLHLLPDALLTWGILTLGEYGRDVLVVSAALLTTLLFAGLAAGAVELADRLQRSRPDALFAVGFLQAAAAFAITVRPGVAVAAGLCGGLTVAIAGGAVTAGELAPDRRRVLRSVGVAAAFVGAGWILAPRSDPLPTDELQDGTVSAMLDLAAGRSFDVPDAEPLVSEQFYQVDINTTTPTVDRADWSLRITGVDRPLILDYDELTSRDAEHRFVTLRCVGDALNGHQMDTALWTGVPIDELLTEAGAPVECCVVVEAHDGYYQAFPRAALERGFLAWRMNGSLLPREHGHPVRALIPGHWGEINVKWISKIEIREEPATGYWEKRGWHGTGPVETIAKLHSLERDGDRIRAGGHAYAGTRGVDRVEVSVDGGETWTDAELTDPLPAAVPVGGDVDSDSVADDAWRQWRFEYDPSANEAEGTHELVVRAIEPDGTVQPVEEAEAFPGGATGWVSRRIDPAEL